MSKDQEQNDPRPEPPPPLPLPTVLMGVSFAVGFTANGLVEQYSHDENLQYLSADRIKRIATVVQALHHCAAELTQLAMEIDPRTFHDERN